jgi:hypothetical protein
VLVDRGEKGDLLGDRRVGGMAVKTREENHARVAGLVDVTDHVRQGFAARVRKRGGVALIVVVERKQVGMRRVERDARS